MLACEELRDARRFALRREQAQNVRAPHLWNSHRLHRLAYQDPPLSRDGGAALNHRRVDEVDELIESHRAAVVRVDRFDDGLRIARAAPERFQEHHNLLRIELTRLVGVYNVEEILHGLTPLHERQRGVVLCRGGLKHCGHGAEMCARAGRNFAAAARPRAARARC